MSAPVITVSDYIYRQEARNQNLARLLAGVAVVGGVFVVRSMCLSRQLKKCEARET